MNSLINGINKLKKSKIKKEIDKKLKEFKKLNKKSNKEWFSEICFCLLTANTSAELGMRIQKEFGYKGFTEYGNETNLAINLKKAK